MILTSYMSMAVTSVSRSTMAAASSAAHCSERAGSVVEFKSSKADLLSATAETALRYFLDRVITVEVVNTLVLAVAVGAAAATANVK